MHRLLVISSSPAALIDGKPFLDVKFVDGMRYFSKSWGDPVSCIVRLRHDVFPFGQTYDPRQLPFNVLMLPSGARIGDAEIRDHDTILCGGWSVEFLRLAQTCSGGTDKKVVFIIEDTPEMIRQIVFLDRNRSFWRKCYALLRLPRQERRRRQAFRIADGIQVNGYPAFALYGPMNANAMMYLDSRIGEDNLATECEMRDRERRQLSGAPLRLLHSGRLEPLKGSQDLVPIACHLVTKGIDFTLDVFGTGSLEDEIREGVVRYGLQDRVRLNGAVSFEEVLVPFARQHADIYLSCQRQSDPSCTYLENMGCGLAVIGYSNRMWSALCRESSAGWVAPMGNVEAIADAVVAADSRRRVLAAASRNARQFAEQHSFENEFKSRIEHLRAIVDS